MQPIGRKSHFADALDALELERCLLIAAGRSSSRRFLVAERFTAADLTLAALMRPAVLVPYFRGHSRLQPLWQ